MLANATVTVIVDASTFAATVDSDALGVTVSRDGVLAGRGVSTGGEEPRSPAARLLASSSRARKVSMSLPNVTYIETVGSRRYRVEGGTITDEWAKGLKAGETAWCEVTIWWDLAVADRGIFYISSYHGSVWPSAWPELFDCTRVHGNPACLLTEKGLELFKAANELGC